MIPELKTLTSFVDDDSFAPVPEIEPKAVILRPLIPNVDPRVVASDCLFPSTTLLSESPARVEAGLMSLNLVNFSLVFISTLKQAR